MGLPEIARPPKRAAACHGAGSFIQRLGREKSHHGYPIASMRSSLRRSSGGFDPSVRPAVCRLRIHVRRISRHHQVSRTCRDRRSRTCCGTAHRINPQQDSLHRHVDASVLIVGLRGFQWTRDPTVPSLLLRRFVDPHVTRCGMRVSIHLGTPLCSPAVCFPARDSPGVPGRCSRHVTLHGSHLRPTG